MVVPPLAQILDVAGPIQVFERASELVAVRFPTLPRAYVTEIVSILSRRHIVTNCGIVLVTARSATAVREPIDTLMFAGGSDMARTIENERFLAWARRAATRARRVASICTGAYVLARLGLLSGRRATTHWKWCDELARAYPKIDVDPNPIFIKSDNVYTSAGVTAGMDLALALVEEDFGSALALAVARELVLYLRRPGGQTQFSTALAAQVAQRQPLRELPAWVLEHIGEPLAVTRLAQQCGVSPRHFARVFASELGLTPARFVEGLRVETARRRLEETTRSVDEIATECGFASADTFRRTFHRLMKVAPGAYRQRFAGGPRRPGYQESRT